MSKDVRALLRQAKGVDPDAFEAAIRDYLERGDAALGSAKPGPRGPHMVSDDVLAMLLADIESIPEGLSERQRIAQLAEGCRYGSGSGVTHQWRNANTIKSHLRDARNLARDSSSFRERVDFIRSCLRTLRDAQSGG